jgi:CRISPR/Cas system-associated endoribonuclease Cas2
MSGKNPFWNYDYNAAQRNREIVDSYQQANEARLDSQQSQFEASMANDRVSRIQMQLNNTINSHKKVVADYEQRLEEYKQFLSCSFHKNILFRTVRRLQRNGLIKRIHP